MTNITKTSEFNEFVYPKIPLGLVDDRFSDNKYRGTVRFNNRRKIYNMLPFNVSHVLNHVDFNMRGNHNNLVDAITFDFSREELKFLSRRLYSETISLMVEYSFLKKVNNNNADRRFYVNPNLVCKLTKEQRKEFAVVHDEYFKQLP